MTYLSYEEYEKINEFTQTLSRVILFEIAKRESKKRDIIIGNFIARGVNFVKAIFMLWKTKNYQDCWILHRCLLERLFYLYELESTNKFDEFYKWSFIIQYESINRLHSNQEFKQKVDSKFFRDLKEKRIEYEQYKSEKVQWIRLRPENIANKMGLGFFYKYGYVYGSKHVHPMANDGHEDFYNITKLEPRPDFPSQEVILHNTLLVILLLLQQSLNATTFKWLALVYNLIQDLIQSLSGLKPEVIERFWIVINMFKDNERLSK